jgi:alpha-glucosidase (family GH31 glycosyl hydrolase)
VMLRFSMYGQPYHECDMTSTSPTDLVRQYQNAVFSPLMRVHQVRWAVTSTSCSCRPS